MSDRLTIEIHGDDYLKYIPVLDSVPLSVERVHIKGIDADDWMVRKCVGYLENHGFKVTWEEIHTDESVVRKSLIGE